MRLSRLDERPRRDLEEGGSLRIEVEGRADLGKRVRERAEGIVGALESQRKCLDVKKS